MHETETIKMLRNVKNEITKAHDALIDEATAETKKARIDIWRQIRSQWDVEGYNTRDLSYILHIYSAEYMIEETTDTPLTPNIYRIAKYYNSHHPDNLVGFVSNSDACKPIFINGIMGLQQDGLYSTCTPVYEGLNVEFKIARRAFEDIAVHIDDEEPTK